MASDRHGPRAPPSKSILCYIILYNILYILFYIIIYDLVLYSVILYYNKTSMGRSERYRGYAEILEVNLDVYEVRRCLIITRARAVVRLFSA